MDFLSRRVERRAFLGMAAGGAAVLAGTRPLLAQSNVLRIAMLHLEPQLAELDRNCDLYESAMAKAAGEGAQWILTPELGLTGYRFDLKMGVDWIKPGPDRWTERLRKAAARHSVTLFLGHLELAADGRRYNTVFAIGPDGAILGRHRKVNTIPVSEGWSTPGGSSAPILVGGHSVGVLICADAWPPDHAKDLTAKGADILVSSATWPPEPHGPETSWEQRTLDTGLPLMVCNRTGVELDFDMRAGESVVVKGGRRLVRHTSEHSTILLVDWESAMQSVVRQVWMSV